MPRLAVAFCCLLLASTQAPSQILECGAPAGPTDDVQTAGLIAFIGDRSSFENAFNRPPVLGTNEVAGFQDLGLDTPILAPIGGGAPPVPGVERRDNMGRIDLNFDPPATTVGFDIQPPASYGCTGLRVRVFNEAGAVIFSRDAHRNEGEPVFVGLYAYGDPVARVAIDGLDGDLPVEETSIEALTVTAILPGFHEYYSDLAGFNAAAGSPAVVADFDAIAPGTDVSDMTFGGVTLKRGNRPSPSAPLIVVRGADTVTPGGFGFVINPATNKLFPTSGENVLSPGGTTLAPGLNPLLENDDLDMIFSSPAGAVGFDLVQQSLDAFSYAFIEAFDPNGRRLVSRMIPNPPWPGPGDGSAAPGGSMFVGITASAGIARIRIDDNDPDAGLPDCNFGFDTIRLDLLPVARCKDRIIEANSSCMGVVSVDDGSNDPDGGGDLVVQESPAGPYPLGVTPVTLTASDSSGAVASCQATVTVVDATPPDISIQFVPVANTGGEGYHDDDDDGGGGGSDDDDHGDDDDDGGNGSGTAKRLSIEVTDACDPNPESGAQMLAAVCPPMIVENGQVLAFDREGGLECEVDATPGLLEVEATSLVVRVTARDNAGNERVSESAVPSQVQQIQQMRDSLKRMQKPR